MKLARLIVNKLYDRKSCEDFNYDVCGLFFCAFLDKTVIFKNEKYNAEKRSKERLTILLATDVNISVKLASLVLVNF